MQETIIMRVLSIIFSVLVIFAGVAFALRNSSSVNVDFVVYQGAAPLSLALVLAFALGALFGVVVSFIMILKQKRTISRLEKLSQVDTHERQKQPYLASRDNA